MVVKHLVGATVGTALFWGIAASSIAQQAAPAQQIDTKQFYKKPETVAEFWRVMKHEIELGQFQLADEYLKGFLAKNPTDQDLLKIHEQEGTSAFLRLLLIPEMAKDAKPLVERVGRVVQKHLTDPARLEKLIRELTSAANDPREAAFATEQLRRAGPAAVPPLLAALTATAERPAEHAAILGVIEKLDQRTTPPLAAALELKNPILRAELIDIFRKRADFAAVPFLWYYSAAPDEPTLVRSKALQTIAALLGKHPEALPRAKDALTAEAEKYYQHLIPLAEPGGKPTIWRMEGNKLTSQAVPISQAEEFYGLLFAGEALRLDPAYEPAQVAFLSMALDKAVERAGIDQPLAKSGPVKEVLTSVNPDLVAAVLRKAIDDKRLPVILAATRALGELADVKAAQPNGAEAPVLLRALNYPDRRVQAAAAEALLRLPRTVSPIAGGRVVEVLRRLASLEGAKVLVVDRNNDRARAVAKALQGAGFESVLASTGKGAMQRLTHGADLDAIVVDADVADPQLNYLLPQFAADIDAARLPIVVTAAPARVDDIQRRFAHIKNLVVIPETTDAGALKSTLTRQIEGAFVKPLSESERKDCAALAMEWLGRIARGEVPGYDAHPAESAILNGLKSKDLANLAIPAVASLPNPEAQHYLARFVLDDTNVPALRAAAAVALTRSIQRLGLQLGRDEIAAIQALYESASDAKLKSNVAVVLGACRPNAKQSGQRLQQYHPSYTAAPPATPTAPPAAEPKAEEPKGAGDN